MFVRIVTNLHQVLNQATKNGRKKPMKISKRKLYYALLILWVMYAWTQLVITAIDKGWF